MLLRTTLLVCIALSSGLVTAQNPPLLGSWQLARHMSCDETQASTDNGKDAAVQEQTPPRVVTFEKKARAEESSPILNTQRPTRKFHYRFTGEMLLILDKKTQTITDSYLVEKLTTDSLIVSSRQRPCDTRVFVRMRQ